MMRSQINGRKLFHVVKFTGEYLFTNVSNLKARLLPISSTEQKIFVIKGLLPK